MNIHSRWALALVTTIPGVVGNLAFSAESLQRTFVYECSNSKVFVAQVDADQAWVFLPGKISALPRVPSASGEKYSDGITMYWSKAQEALVEGPDNEYRDCINNRARAIWEASKLRGNDFRATGNEPGWYLEIASTEAGRGPSLLFVSAYGEQRISFPFSDVFTNSDTRTTRYEADTKGKNIVIVLRGRPCSDTMSGEQFATSVEINFDGKQFRGCGRALH